MQKNAYEIKYELMKLFNHLVLFTPWRIDRNSLKDSLHVYELRFDDEINNISQLGNYIMVNFWGTVISKVSLLDENERYLDINEEDIIDNIDHLDINLDDYLNQKYILIEHKESKYE